MKWFAELVYSFECPTCKQRVPEGNPALCPHQDGRSVRYDPKRHGPVVNVRKVLKRLQVELLQKPKESPAPTPKAPVLTCVQGLVDLMCPKGT